MKKNILISLLLAFGVATIVAAPSVDLTKVSTNAIYESQVGGVPQKGVLQRVSVTLPDYKSAVVYASPQKMFDAINQLQPWYSTDISTIFTKRHNLTELHVVKFPQNEIFFMALELEEGGYMVVQPIAALDVMSWIEVKGKNSIDMVCASMGTDDVKSAEVPMFAYAKGEDLYGTLYELWDKVLSCKEVKGRTNWRDSKTFPEPFNYLGWCTWEQYRKNINESMLVDAVDRIEHSDVPIRWVLVDDGHQTHDEGLTLRNFDVSKRKFPNGWAPVLAKRSDKVKWFGLWHCMFGEWRGISPTHTMEPLREHTITLNTKTNAQMVDESQEGSEYFFKELVGSVANPGFDFTKIDVQTRDFKNYIGKGNAVKAHRQNAENLEVQVNDRLQGMINCMAQNLPCIFNTRYSAVTRVSVDYKLNNIPLVISHIYQSYHNTSWMGQTVWPDHDMFHSSDSQFGRLMAVSKAMSGAPVYLSDAPKDMKSEFIMPLVYSDGELLRPLAPGAPIPSSFFADALMGSDEYKVIAPMTKTSAAIVAYNISSNYPKRMDVAITADDYRYADAMVQPYPGLRSVPKEGLVYYDWYAKRGGELKDGYRFNLPTVTDKIVLLTEIKNGWSVVGLEGKYLSTVAVKSTKSSERSLDIEMYESGDIIVYSKRPIKSAGGATIEALGGGIYRVLGANVKVTLRR